MFIIGLTGSLATGKSSVAKMFKECGGSVIDADKIVHDLLKDHSQVKAKVQRHFKECCDEQGVIQRDRLADCVFKEEAKLEILEGIIHPCVKTIIDQEIKDYHLKQTQCLILDIPLLFEQGFDKKVDVTVVVYANQQLQLERSVGCLGITKREALRRIKKQDPIKEKMKMADVVIDNSGSLKDTKKRVKETYRLFIKQYI